MLILFFFLNTFEFFVMPFIYQYEHQIFVDFMYLI